MPYKFEVEGNGDYFEVYKRMASESHDDETSSQGTLVRRVYRVCDFYVSVKPGTSVSRNPAIPTEVFPTSSMDKAIDFLVAKLEADQKKETAKIARKDIQAAGIQQQAS